MAVDVVVKGPKAIRGKREGETVNVTRNEAKLLVSLGRAEYAPSEVDAPVERQAPIVRPTPVQETKELTAEDISPRTGRPKRQYRRRDMQAEE